MLTDAIINKTINSNDADSLTRHQNLWVCRYCLMAIEAHEGKQITEAHEIDDDSPTPCEWCEENGFDTLYELL